MNKILSKNKFKIVTAVLALGAAAAAKKFIDSRYEHKTGDEPPVNPQDENYNLMDVLIYTSATALIGSVISVLVRDLVTRQWKHMDGDLPSELRG